MPLLRKHFCVRGRVQGVGFRYFTVSLARKLGLVGWSRNCVDGSVEGEVEGETAAVQKFLQGLQRGPSLANVEELLTNDLEIKSNEEDFEIQF